MNNKCNNTPILFTYQQYLNGECTHQEYYDQFVTNYYIALLSSIKQRILNSKDKHLNDIELRTWDTLANFVTITKEHKDKYGLWNCLSSKVCILKAAARRIQKENKNEN